MLAKRFFSVLVLASLLVGCGSQPTSIIGRWEMARVVAEEEVSELSEVPYDNLREVIEFRPDGTMTVAYSSDDGQTWQRLEGCYDLTGDHLLIELLRGEFGFGYEYTVRFRRNRLVLDSLSFDWFGDTVEYTRVED